MMWIGHAIETLVLIFLVVSMLACGDSGGGDNASSKGQSPLESGGFRSTVDSRNPLVGTWASGGYSLTFKSDNTFLSDLNRDGVPDVSGSVVISGNVVIFSDAAGGNYSTWLGSGQVISGSYTYAINGNTLTFSPVLDLCSDQTNTNILCLSYQKR